VPVRVVPRGGRDEVAGHRAGALVVRLSAAPVDGRANQALLRVLARALGVPPSAVAILRGAAGRDKVVHVRGLAASALQSRVDALSQAKQQ
jgi:uncharacterized protein YggU (UPF0235/DUF167 family)